MVVDAHHPIQFPRSYAVGDQLWTLYSTVAQDSMEVHLARTDLRALQPLGRTVLTHPDHNLSAYASLAISPDRVAIAFDDDSFGPRTSHMTLLDVSQRAPASSISATQPNAMFADSTSASVLWNPLAQQWLILAAANNDTYFARLRADGTLIAGSSVSLSATRYYRGCGETFLWTGSEAVALVRSVAQRWQLLVINERSHRIVELGLPVAGQLGEASLSYDHGRWGVAWMDDEGAKVSVVTDEQTHSRVLRLSSGDRSAGNPVIAFARDHHVVLWTENPSTTLIRRAFVTRDGTLAATDTFATHPTEHQWWPHLAPIEDGRRLVYTWQSGQTQALLWLSE